MQDFDTDVPEVTWLNAVLEEAEEWTRKPKVMHVGRRLLYTHRKYTVTFNCPPDLREFPFDIQALKVRGNPLYTLHAHACARTRRAYTTGAA